MSQVDVHEEPEPTMREVMQTIGRLADGLERLLDEGLPESEARMKETFDGQIAEVRRYAKRNRWVVRGISVVLVVALLIGWREHTGRIAEHHDRIVAQNLVQRETQARIQALRDEQYRVCETINSRRAINKVIFQSIVDTALDNGVKPSVVANIETNIAKLKPTACTK